MILTLKIEKLFDGYYVEEFVPCERIIEVEDNTTLEELHLIILESVEFDEDHMYEFFIADSIRSKEKIRFDEENKKVWRYSIKDLYPLKKHKKIFYLFDYGASWYFRILKTKVQPKDKEEGAYYPTLIKKVGPNPAQYDPRYEDEQE